MAYRVAVPAVLAFVLCLSATAPAADAKTDPNDLSMEIDALQLIYQLDLSPRQLQALAKIAKDTAQPARDRKASKASDKLRALMTDLRAALRKNDGPKIDDLTDKVDELKDKENASFDDTVEITEGARKKAAEAMRLLTTRQFTDYLNLYDDLPDPVVSVREALKKGVKLTGKEWKELRDETADEVGWLIGGLDTEKTAKAREQAVTLLDKFHALKEDELTKQREDIDAAVQGIMGDVGPVEVLKHIVERDFAELLSNPQLSAAIEGRLAAK